MELREKFLAQIGGRLDVLVNNVGEVPALGSVTELTRNNWDQNLNLNLNLTSQFLTTKTFLPELRRSSNGLIISMTSMELTLR